MRKEHFIIFLIIVLGFFSSCSSMYMPNVPATPMFRQAGEGFAAAHVNLKGNVSGTLGGSLSDHFAILVNGSSVNNGVKSNDYFKQWSAEAAVGYFNTLGKDKRQVIEFYGGYGVGNSVDIDQRASVVGYDVDERREMNFDKVFVQLNYSSTRKKKINLFGGKRELNYGTAIRLSRIGMKEFWINNTEADREENYFIEPLFFTRLQLKNGFQIQYTSGFNISLLKNEYLKAGNAVFTLGVVYNFGNKKIKI